MFESGLKGFGAGIAVKLFQLKKVKVWRDSC
jgi:hypothetical protein